MSRTWWCCAAGIVLLAASSTHAFALPSAGTGDPASVLVSGAPVEIPCAPAPATPRVPAGLDDLLQPLIDAPRARSASAVAQPQPPADAPPVWKALEALSPAERANAAIEIEPGASKEGGADRLADDVSAWWQAGRYDEAIAALRAWEDAGGRCALGVAWKTPVSSGARSGGGDVRIGTLDLGHDAVLDFDAGTGNLFAVMRWGLSVFEFTVNLSTDGGATWSETYAYHAGWLPTSSAAVVAGHLYVGYVNGDAENELRVRRFMVSNGAPDVTYGYQAILDAGAASIFEVAVASNAEDYDNRIYCVTLQSDRALRFAWDEATDGRTFSEVASPVADAASALDASWSNGWTCNRTLYMSYVDTRGYVHVQAVSGTGWTDLGATDPSSDLSPTSISVHDQTVICAYDYDYVEGRGVRYAISYDCGSTWNYGSIAIPNGTTVTEFRSADVDARDGRGLAIVYGGGTSAVKQAYYRVRPGYQPGAWLTPWAFNNHNAVISERFAISHLHTPNPNNLCHGAIYYADGGMGGTPYFDLPGAGVLDVAGPPPPAALALSSTGSNPTRGPVRLELALPRAAQVEIGVYDVRGSRVREIARGAFTAGRHPFAWDGAAPAGIYFVRARSSLGRAQLTVVRLR